jgi:two-component system CheB/CheR fusion protein
MTDIEMSKAHEAHSSWYASTMERLLSVVQELSQTRDIDAITAIVRDAARSLTGADGATFVLRDGNQCHYVDENAISPLWKGRRFPMSACISGWAMLNAKPAVIEDIYSDPRIPADAYRSTFVKSLAMVPIRRSAPLGAIGNYWATRRMPTDEEVAVLQALADTTAVALQNAQLYTELRQKVADLQEQRTRVQAQRYALEVFARALAHDLKEPVRSICSFSEIIARGDVPDHKARQYFKYIQSAADRMGMLIESVFDFTQLDDIAASAKEPCDMGQAVEAVRANIEQFIHDKGAMVTASALPTVHGNSSRLTQMLQHLVDNAIRHGSNGVRVRIDAEERVDSWLFSVIDDGPGIAPEHAETIFLPFKRLTGNPECAGMGLAICRKIIAYHGGAIWCMPSAGNGASFFFTLPKDADSATISPQIAVAESPEPIVVSTQKQELANVLLVDDLDDDLELTRLMLFERAGLKCNLHAARGGDEALEVLQRTARDGDPIDLMLLDINMPAMDGFELLTRLRTHEAFKRVPVVMCTGSTYEKDQQRAEALGAAGYVVKPPSWRSLKPILEQIETLRIQQKEEGVRLMRAA